MLADVAPKHRLAHGGSELPRHRVLLAGDIERERVTILRILQRRRAIEGLGNLALQTIDLGEEKSLFVPLRD